MAGSHYAVSTVEAIPTHIRPQGHGLAVIANHPGHLPFGQAQFVTRRGGADAGLVVTAG